jgi:predicted methyltransferase
MSPSRQGSVCMKSSASDTSTEKRVRLVAVVHAELKRRIQSGDTVVDATVGNGYDTLAMAEAVGSDGRVIGFDIQAQAIDATRQRLEAAGMMERVELHCTCHSHLAQCLTTPIAAIVFNLGYLPGADHARITQAATSRAAMKSAWQLLQPGGCVSVVAYTGHDGGRSERDAVAEWMRGKADSGHLLKTIIADPAKIDSPEWFCLEKVG